MTLKLPRALSAALVLAGCGGTATTTTDGATGGTTPDMAMAATCTGGNTKGTVLVKLAFAAQNPRGVSVGFDLDNYTAMVNDPKTCGHASLTSPDGQKGIDNSFSDAIPAIDAATQGAFEGELQDAINGGMLLIGINLTGVDDRMNDSCVGVDLYRLTGMPTVGTDKILDANQTFTVDKAAPVSHTQGAIKSGVLTVTPFEATLPVRVLDANFNLAVHNAHFQINVADDMAITGVIGGAISKKEIEDDLQKYAIGAQLSAALPAILDGIADQAYDATAAECTQFSVALTITAKPAFIDQ